MPAEAKDKTPTSTLWRFLVYLEEGSTFKLNKRLTVINFRRQAKGLGACALNLLPKNAFKDEVVYDKQDSIFLRDNKYSEPKPGQRFFILDTKNLTEVEDELYEVADNIVFWGRIRTSTLEKYKDQSDFVGEVAGDEDGWHWYHEPMFTSVLDTPFNAVVNGYFIGNKRSGNENQFELYEPKRLKSAEFGETEWSDSDLGNVWSLEEAIQYVGSGAGVTIKMPWEQESDRIASVNAEGNYYEDPTQRQKKYKFFKDKKKPRSFSSAYGKSFTQWLDENLLDSFTYYFKYESTSAPTCYLINKSLIDTELFPKVFAPYKVTVTPESKLTNLNITEVGETYTQVEVRSNRILFAGTLTTKNLGVGQKTLDRNWTYNDEKKYAWGHDTLEIEVTTPLAFRNSWKNQKAYQQFKFNKLESYSEETSATSLVCPIIVSNPMDFTNEFTERQTRPFFPFVSIIDTATSKDYGTVYVSDSMSSHKTPDTANLKWADKLPFGYSDSTSKYNLFEPFVSTTVTNNKDFYKSIVHFVGDSEKPELTIGDEVKISFKPPETLGYVDNSAELFKINGQNFEPSLSENYDWANGASKSDRNPATTGLGVYPYLTHWSMIYLTVAGYSSQRISLYKSKDSPGIASRKKIIEADDCEYWIAHYGTFKPLVTFIPESDPAYAQGYNCIPEVIEGKNSDKSKKHQVIRNDFKKQKAYLDYYSDFLFLEKKALTLDFTLDDSVNEALLTIGNPIASIVDKQSITTNSVIESIEYFIEGGNPRIRISTLIPEMPPMKALADSVRIEGSAPVISPMANFKSNANVKTPNAEPRINELKIKGNGGSGGGGSTPADVDVYIVQANNILEPSNFEGIAYKQTAPTTTSVSLSGSVSTWADYTFEDGLGVGINVRDGTGILIINTSPAPTYDLLAGTYVNVLTSGTVEISGAGGTTSTAYKPFNVF